MFTVWMVRVAALGVCAACLGCAGLGSGPDISSEKQEPGQKYSNAEVRRMFVDQPFLGSGDYFRERQWTGSGEENSGPESAAKDRTEDLGRIEQRVASLEESVHTQQSSDLDRESVQEDSPEAVIDPEQVKLGFLLDRTALKPGVEKELTAAVTRMARSSSWRIYTDQALQELLAPTGYLQDKNLAKITQTLSLYPGLRMLLLIEDADLPQEYPGHVGLTLSMVDTGLPYRYPLLEMESEIQKASELDGTLLKIFTRLTEYAAGKSQIMPRHYRVFALKGEKVVINGGRKSPLAPGDVLDVIPSGETVTTPTGVPVGWMPDTATGRIRVQEILGPDAAVCVPVGEGASPEQGAYVLPHQED